MATLIVAIREDNAYVGIGKQSQGGTAIAPSYFPRWLDGSNIQLDIKAEDVWEGDGSRRLSLIIKNRQEVKGKLVVAPRPNELGFLEAAAQGAGSDAFTAPAASTTLAAAATAGQNSISLTADTGLTTSGSATVIIDPGLATEEIVTITTPPSGAGPYTATLANGATLQQAHASGATVETAATHVMTDQSDGNFYSFEVSLGGTAGIILRARDCKIEQIKRSAKAGGLLTYEVDWQGVATIAQPSASTVTLEPHPPFLYTQGVWTLDGSTTGDALAIESFDITQKNNLDTTIQTEQLTLATLIFGNVTLDVGLNLVMQSGDRIAETYFGGASGTTDAQALATGSVQLVFTQANAFFVVTYDVPALTYTKTEPPAPKKDGKAFRLAVAASSTSDMGANAFLLQTTVANSVSSAY